MELLYSTAHQVQALSANTAVYRMQLLIIV